MADDNVLREKKEFWVEVKQLFQSGNVLAARALIVDARTREEQICKGTVHVLSGDVICGDDGETMAFWNMVSHEIQIRRLHEAYYSSIKHNLCNITLALHSKSNMALLPYPPM